MKKLRQVVGSGLVALGFLVSCGGQPPPPAEEPEPAGPSGGIEAFLPLPKDHVYSYTTFREGQEIGTLIMQLEHPRKGRVDLRMGNQVTRLEVEAQGVRNLEGGWLLKLPLKEGATWKGKAGDVRISSMSKSLTVPAGSYQNCVETVEEAGGAGESSRSTAVYCPDVGLTQLTIEAMKGTELLQEEMKLKSFGPKVDVNNLAFD